MHEPLKENKVTRGDQMCKVHRLLEEIATENFLLGIFRFKKLRKKAECIQEVRLNTHLFTAHFVSVLSLPLTVAHEDFTCEHHI